jgi:hypothetical protein
MAFGQIIPNCNSKEDKLKKDSDEKTDNKKYKKFRFSMFFDGTLNNRSNVQARKESTDENFIGPVQGKVQFKKYGGKDTSYENYYTNIVFLERYMLPLHKEDFKHYRIYIEGIGTDDFQSDSKTGYAFGKGDYGVDKKVERGLKEIVDMIKAEVSDKENTIVDNIDIDIFGFSRGAAAARFFIYMALKSEDLAIKKQLSDYSISEIKFCFGGLFDTVASYGPWNTFWENSNTADLHLNSIAIAEKVVHLCAADEHRKNFSLTNINSACGDEYFLPGVHSDIGGGYNDNVIEEELQIIDKDTFYLTTGDKQKILQDIKYLIEKGWFYKNEILGESTFEREEIAITDTDILGAINFFNEVYVTRKGAGKGISNKYSRISLHLMKSEAVSAGLKFISQIDKDLETEISSDLIDVQNFIYSHLGNCKSKPNYWENDNSEILKKIRHNYCHFSAFYGEIAGAHNPKFVDGKRTRIIHKG